LLDCVDNNFALTNSWTYYVDSTHMWTYFQDCMGTHIPINMQHKWKDILNEILE
jgi:hypothetical protein